MRTGRVTDWIEKQNMGDTARQFKIKLGVAKRRVPDRVLQSCAP